MIALAEADPKERASETDPASVAGSASSSPRLSGLAELLILAALFLPLFLVGLDWIGLVPGPETDAADAGRAIVDGSAGALTPVVEGERRFDRLPLPGWLAAWSRSRHGPDVAALRRPHAFAMFAVLLAVWGFVRIAGRPDAALAAAIVLGTTYEIGVAGRLADGTAFSLLFSTVAFFALYLAVTAPADKRRGWLFVAGTSLGLVFLSRGAAGWALPLLGISMFLFARGQFRSGWRRLLSDPIGWAFFAAITLPWFVGMLVEHGHPFFAEFVGENTMLVFERDRVGLPSGGLFAGIPRLLLGFFPWSGLIPIALIHLIPFRGSGRDAEGEPAPIDRRADLPLFTLCGAFVVLVGFSLAWTKFPHAMILGFAPLAIAIGLAFSDLRRMIPSLGFRISIALCGVVGLGIALWLNLSPVGAGWFGWTMSIQAAREAAGAASTALRSETMMVLSVVLVAGGATFVALRRARPVFLFRVLAGAGILHVILAAQLAGVVDRAGVATVRSLAPVAIRRADDAAEVVVYRLASAPTVGWYEGRDVRRVGPEEMARLLASGPVVGLARRSDLGEIEDLAAGDAVRVIRREGDHVVFESGRR